MIASSTIYFLSANSPLIQAISTLVLVAVTAVYTSLTRSAVKEARKTRQDLQLPIIKLGVQGIVEMSNSGPAIDFHFENLGHGLALNMELVLPCVIENNVVEIGNLDKKEELFSRIYLAPLDDQKLSDLADEEKIIFAQYDDIFGRKIKTKAKFSYDLGASFIDFSITDWRIILPK